jgi:DNA modification methylase
MDGPPVPPKFHLAQRDAVAWLRALPSDSIDLVITDPPYESLEKHRAIGTTTRLKHSKSSSNDWFSIFPNARFPELFAEVYRVLRRNTHFYLFCDPETMFVAKPLAEAAGFKFWKPLIWDKCLGPDTLVWTTRGVRRIANIEVGDRVAIPEGGTTAVLATRRTRARALRLSLSDGTQLVTSSDHRLVRADGAIVEAQQLTVGETLCVRPVRERTHATLDLDALIPDDEVVFELPDTTGCLWCGQAFEGLRAAAAHQARFCDAAMSKAAMAEQLGISAKRLRRWLSEGRIPKAWATILRLDGKLRDRVQCTLQNNVEIWYPRTLPMTYELGKVIGLYAAEGSVATCGVSFAMHADEKHLHNLLARFVRSLGLRANVRIEGNRACIDVNFKIMEYLVGHFVGGNYAPSKFFKPSVYAAPSEFRQGVLDGLIEGDGHWSHDEQRETYTSASADLAMFVRRELAERGRVPTVESFANDHAGGWRVRFDPIKSAQPLSVLGIDELGEQDLVDISVADRDELFLLANGVVTHNCKIGMGYHYRARYECILFFEKGKRKLSDLGIADILEASRISGGYPAEKPPAVSEILIRQSTEPGQLVIDPFMGSGSVGVAAVTSGRMFLGNDLCKEAVDITRGRLREAGAVEASEIGEDLLPVQAGRVGQLGLAGLAHGPGAPGASGGTGGAAG